jgi:hypothetical protein
MPIIAGRASAAYGAGFAAVTTVAFAPIGAYDALATVIVPSGGLSSITFAGIPQTGYSHLQIRGILKTTTNSNSDGNLIYRFNDDSGANYSQHALQANGSSASSGGGGNSTNCGIGFATGSNANNTNTFAGYVIDILNYANPNTYKTTRSQEGYVLPGVEGSCWIRSNNWRSFAGINQITFSGSTFVENASFTLYGVK